MAGSTGDDCFGIYAPYIGTIYECANERQIMGDNIRKDDWETIFPTFGGRLSFVSVQRRIHPSERLVITAPCLC